MKLAKAMALASLASVTVAVADPRHLAIVTDALVDVVSKATALQTHLDGNFSMDAVVASSDALVQSLGSSRNKVGTTDDINDVAEATALYLQFVPRFVELSDSLRKALMDRKPDVVKAEACGRVKWNVRLVARGVHDLQYTLGIRFPDHLLESANVAKVPPYKPMAELEKYIGQSTDDVPDEDDDDDDARFTYGGHYFFANDERNIFTPQYEKFVTAVEDLTSNFSWWSCKVARWIMAVKRLFGCAT
ncbi:hypothetical protein DCS_06134 [Drechmeria coniospora]|uniref:Cell wall galactomannoprotein n=1 Tax=Drechmeria coniospora TaxID=98403 RepID=A0A151GAS3_DRECN|nr:hypothetical protein DCS_06134 [Drechmeria coniospora]KYK54177.1 hypothetical protein DCS_06134 [Drechmeria coniospora]